MWRHLYSVLILLLALFPAYSGAGETLRIAVISDMNGAYGSTEYDRSVKAAVERIVGLKPDLVINAGDMVAGQRRPHLGRPQVERMWQAFHQLVSDPLAAAAIPQAPTPGNHDASAYDGFQLERTLYAEQWTPRRPAVQFVDGGGYPFYYAFELGDVLFISVDATTVGQLPAQQMQWLRGVLAQHGPQRRRRVLFSHLPLWPFAQGREREYIGDPALQTLLKEAKVDLYLSGHHHAFYPGLNDGLALVSQSCLGAGPRRLIGDNARSPRSFTWIEIGDGAIQVAAYRAPRFDTAIDWATLPERIHSAAAELVRADLAGSDVIVPVETVPAP